MFNLVSETIEGGVGLLSKVPYGMGWGVEKVGSGLISLSKGHLPRVITTLLVAKYAKRCFNRSKEHIELFNILRSGELISPLWNQKKVRKELRRGILWANMGLLVSVVALSVLSPVGQDLWSGTKNLFYSANPVVVTNITDPVVVTNISEYFPICGLDNVTKELVNGTDCWTFKGTCFQKNIEEGL